MTAALPPPNPYSPTAVARLTHFEDESAAVTVPTVAIREAIGHLDAYLDEMRLTDVPGRQAGHGNVVAVVGDYGTGKTHLAVEVLRHARTHLDKDTHIVYVDAQPSDFVELYKRFIGGLQLSDTVGRVREFYQDVVIEHLRNSPLTEPIAEVLSTDDELDVRAVVAGIGMDDTALTEPFLERLRGITGNATLVTAFALLLRPGFEDAVWDWFRGARPAEILRERGIDVQIDTEDAALEAMNVIALLYGRHNHRLIVVVDEIEKALSASRPLDAALVPMKRMLDILGDVGTFLLIAGIPDILQVLPPDVMDRVGAVIHMPPLTTAQTRQLIVETQDAAGLPAPEPFTDETIDHLRKLADGIPRRIIRLCYHIYRRAVDSERLVTVEMVRDAARAQIGLLTVDDLRVRVRTLLGAEGLAHTARYALDGDQRSRLDEWVELGDGAGFGVLVTESVLDEVELEQFRQRALAIQAARAGVHVLLIVNGYIEESAANQLGELFNQQPLVYEARSFDQDLAGTVRAMARRLRGAEAGGSESVAQVARQQTNLYLFIEQLGNRLDSLRESTERRFDALTGYLQEAPGAAEPGAAEPEVAGTSKLPPVVGRLFSSALDALSDLRRVDTALRQVFTLSASTDVAAYRRSIAQFRAALRAPRATPAVSAITLLQRLVTVFQENVSDWYRSYGVDNRGQVLSSDEQQLKALCGAYDAVYEYLPAYEIQGLSEFAEAYSVSPELDYASRSSRGSDLQEILDGLGARVQRTMLEAVSAR